MTPDRTPPAAWAPPVPVLIPPDDPVALTVVDERPGPPATRVRLLEVVFLAGLAGVFLVNAIVAALQPSDFTTLVDKSAIADWVNVTAGDWVAPVIFVNDLLIGLGLLGAIWARHTVRTVILAWAGMWFFVVTLVKLTALNSFP